MTKQLPWCFRIGSKIGVVAGSRSPHAPKKQEHPDTSNHPGQLRHLIERGSYHTESERVSASYG